MASARLISLPWPHLIVDNFLPPRILAKSRAEIAAAQYDYEIESRGTGRIEFSPLQSKTLWRAVYSQRTTALLASAFEVTVQLNKDNLLQLRRMNDDTPEFPVHNDFAANQDSIASFLYLSSGWSEERGGRFRLFTSDKDTEPGASVEPIENRFIAFQTKPAHWHAVERVYAWERLSVLALWDVNGRI